MRHRSHSCLLAGVLLLVCCVMGDSRLTLDACTTVQWSEDVIKADPFY